MPIEEVKVELSQENEDVKEIDVEETEAVEIDVTGRKTEEEYRAEQEPEVEDAGEPELEIELVDDTPKEDRGREPMEEPPEDVTEEELEGYSSKVRKRINKIQRGYHDERRAKESAERERQEAVRVAQKLIEENKALKGDVSKSRDALLDQAKRNAAIEVLSAKKAYKDAYEAGDADKVVEAQEKLTAAKIKADKVANFTPEPLQEEDYSATIESDTSEQVDPKAQEWASRNTWFGTNTEMTELARGLHNHLVSSGVDPSSDEYYEKIDSRMQQIFPDQFEDAPKKKRASVVAPATRSTSPKKVKLNPSQQQLAKRLGITYEQYAHQMILDARKV